MFRTARATVRTAYRDLDVATFAAHVGAVMMVIGCLASHYWGAAATFAIALPLLMGARYYAVTRSDARADYRRADRENRLMRNLRDSDNKAITHLAASLDEELDTNAELRARIRDLRDRPTLHQQIANLCDLYGHTTTDTPRLLDDDTALARLDFIQEEVDELAEAIAAHDLEAIADALVDIEVFTAGTGAMYGIDMDACHAEVMRSNLAKRNPETGEFDKDENGKVVKPAGWEAPNLARVLGLEPSLAA